MTWENFDSGDDEEGYLYVEWRCSRCGRSEYKGGVPGVEALEPPSPCSCETPETPPGRFRRWALKRLEPIVWWFIQLHVDDRD